ncbi:MAG: hypothetical protein ACRC1P_11015 [Cellulosilyticaceae bacterium]
MSRSNFPNQVDTFMEHYDISPSDIPSIARFQELKAKMDLTSEETVELNNLSNVLRNKLWTAEDLNKIQDCMVNLETFFKNQTEVYINNLFNQYDTRMNNLETRNDNMITTSQNQISTAVGQADAKVVEVDNWWNGIKNNIQVRDYFDFDNWTSFSKVIYSTVFTSNVITETLKNKGNMSTVSTRSTNFNSDGSITVRVKVFDGSTVLLDRTETTSFNGDGSITSEVIN